MRTLATGESDLLLALYNGPYEQPLWHRFLDILRAQTGAAYAELLFRPVDGSAFVQLFSGNPRTEQLQQSFFQHCAADPRTMREGRVYALEELIDPADPAQRSFYEEQLLSGVLHHHRSLRVTEPGGIDAWLAIVDDQGVSAATTAMLSRLVPHLRVALHSFVVLERERLRSSISSEAIGRLNFGWLTLDPQCRIVDATANVEQIFRRTSMLRRGRYDRLTFAAARLESEVGALVRAFAEKGECRPRAFNISRDPWMDIFVTPLPDRMSISGSNAVAIVYLSGDHQSRSDRCEQLVDLFGLQPSEARLAWVIAQGRSISQAAEELGISRETARSYSKQIYSKTGASGQAELIRIIFTSVLTII